MRLLRFCLSCLLLIGLSPISETRAPETSPPYQGISGSGNNFLEICKHVDEESDAKYTLNNGLCLGWMVLCDRRRAARNGDMIRALWNSRPNR